MSIRSWLCKHLCSYLIEENEALKTALGKRIAREVASPPKKDVKFSRDECYKILKSQLNCKDAIMVLGSDYYFPVTKEEMARFLGADLTDAFPYTKTYKCRNFSFKLLGDAQIPAWADITLFGIWASGHAFNCFIDKNKKVWFIEPQTDEIFDPNSEKGRKFKNNVGFIVG